ncbi:unnamed protein product [Fusarium graminearum]|uniref:Chromosome 2, complete genome n=2 Tax=Gibberella zeae TaxID=5518 RepID=A0A0E0S7J8_GIBZE|nr:hypothetical protein FG05_30455 [Fusarium graminearum]CAF3517465.1 unnamed protein product [Fusarium graminearum]CAF3532707.1 unnamed protein product [Fusarium graminearum]CAF3655882.1 unnamed protein product [Fusarium graminearum]CAG1992397.1 unnamed protein product [Fusarium graminearum]
MSVREQALPEIARREKRKQLYIVVANDGQSRDISTLPPDSLRIKVLGRLQYPRYLLSFDPDLGLLTWSRHV